MNVGSFLSTAASLLLMLLPPLLPLAPLGLPWTFTGRSRLWPGLCGLCQLKKSFKEPVKVGRLLLGQLLVRRPLQGLQGQCVHVHGWWLGLGTAAKGCSGR